VDGVTGFGKVYLVQKKCGVDKDKLYAMKVMDLAFLMEDRKGSQRLHTELYLHDKGTDYPFLVGYRYCFQTESKVCLFLGEYINNYS
jgi:hypothetical protein